jgi:hypothetical protein
MVRGLFHLTYTKKTSFVPMADWRTPTTTTTTRTRSGKTCPNLKSKQHCAYELPPTKKIKPNNDTVVAELPMHSVFEGVTAADRRWQCDGCNAYFESAQGLGSHKNSCTLLRDQLMQSVQGTGLIFVAFKNGPPGSVKQQRHIEGINTHGWHCPRNSNRSSHTLE